MITFDEIVDNKEYRERVIKFFRLPIRLSVSKEKFMSDLEFMKKTQADKYKEMVKFTEHDFNKIVSEQGTGSPDFTMEDIIEPIVEKVEKMESWRKFIEEDYSDTLAGYEGITSTHQFYKKDNDGKYFVSFDLKSANWQSLQHITGIEESYEDYIVKYTDNLIPRKSKTVRTKITALLNAKKIMDYNKHLLNSNKDEVLKSIFKNTKVDLRNETPFAFYADEFLMEIEKDVYDKMNNMNLTEIEESVRLETGIDIHLTPFRLKWLNVNKGCVKEYKDGFEYINLSKDIVLILNKLMHDIDVKEVDFEGIKLDKETKDDFLKRLTDVSNYYYQED